MATTTQPYSTAESPTLPAGLVISPTRAGFASWALMRDHKRIGLMFLVRSIGGLLASGGDLCVPRSAPN